MIKLYNEDCISRIKNIFTYRVITLMNLLANKGFQKIKKFKIFSSWVLTNDFIYDII